MEYPSNSINKKTAPAPAEAPKVAPVVTGKVVTRKTSVGKRLKEVFIGADATSVWAYVAYDILIPAIKDTIADAGRWRLSVCCLVTLVAARVVALVVLAAAQRAT